MVGKVGKHVLLVAVLSIAAFGQAQLRSMDSTRDGRGTLSFRTRSSSTNIRRARVILRDNGRAEIQVLSGVSETFSGRWKNGSVSKVFLEIDKVGRDSASGTGQVIHDGRGNFASVFCNGSVGRTKFDFKFEATMRRPGGGGWDNGGVRERTFLDNAEAALRREFRGSTLHFSHEKVGQPRYGSRTVTGKFRAEERRRDVTYEFTVVCNSRTGEVKSTHYSRK